MASPASPTAPPLAAPAPSAAAPQRVRVPELRGATPLAAADLLTPLGLRLGQRQTSCDLIGATPLEQPRLVGSILCQSLPPDSLAPPGISIDYVVYEGDR